MQALGEGRADAPLGQIEIDLGPGNVGSVHPDTRLSASKLRRSLTDPDLRRPHSGGWHCIDGRPPAVLLGESGVEPRKRHVHAQMPGSLSTTETAVDVTTMSLTPEDRLSFSVASNTRQSIENGQLVVVHGDDHTLDPDTVDSRLAFNKNGCIAMAVLRDGPRSNARNREAVAPLAVFIGGVLDLGEYFAGKTKDQEAALAEETNTQIDRGQRNADLEKFWDIDPESVFDITVANGAHYEVLHGNHGEGVASLEMTDDILDELAFMEENTIILPDGTEIVPEAFVASLGIYKNYMFRRAQLEGQSEPWAARRTIGGVLTVIGVLKRAVAPDFPASIIYRPSAVT